MLEQVCVSVPGTTDCCPCIKEDFGKVSAQGKYSSKTLIKVISSKQLDKSTTKWAI